jgi:hypothetical protein
MQPRYHEVQRAVLLLGLNHFYTDRPKKACPEEILYIRLPFRFFFITDKSLEYGVGFPWANRREARKLGLLRKQKFRS